MNEYLGILRKSKLFNGLADEGILTVLNCLNAKIKTFSKNNVIFGNGEEAPFVGVILSGEVQVQKTDYDGNANIISKLYPADLIAASVCYSSDKRLPFDITCPSDCSVLCLDRKQLIQTCCNACAFHAKIVQNMLNIIADKNIMLADKIDILTKRTIKEKILAYLFSHSKQTKNKMFSIPVSRRQMAEFLSVNRSALSRELCSLRDEGILEFDKNSFLLKIK